MVKYIAKVSATGPFALQGLPVDHSIDVPFELAKTIYMMPSRGGARFDKKLQRVKSDLMYTSSPFHKTINICL